MEADRVMEIIVESVADCLELDEHEVSPTSRLVDDLGADSLDIVDLVFTLEKRFGITLRGGELDILSRLDLSDPAVVQDGFLTEHMVRQLEVWLPELAAAADRSRIAPAAVTSMITLETLHLLVQRRLDAAPGTP